jgi:hypothetical protein
MAPGPYAHDLYITILFAINGFIRSNIYKMSLLKGLRV